MDRDEAIRLLRGGRDGVVEWNQRRGAGEEIPALSRADLGGANLSWAILDKVDFGWADIGEADLRGASLCGAVLRRADLARAALGGADLTRADLTRADLTQAVLTRAVLRGADLDGADLSEAALGGADLRGAILRRTDLRRAILTQADLSEAGCGLTVFGDVDLSEVKGLESIEHQFPSTVGVDALARSRGRIPEAFLRGCGLTPWEALAANLYRPELTSRELSDLQSRISIAWTEGRSMINGCFISYSWRDANFVDKLCDHLHKGGISTYLDRHDMVAGTIQDQVWRAIQRHHVMIIVLSAASVESDWVENELDMARRKEKDEGRAVLCPIALDDAWRAKVEAKDSPGDPSRQLWRTLTQKLIVDFSGWETEAFDGAFQKLLRGLKLHYGPGSPGSS